MMKTRLFQSPKADLGAINAEGPWYGSEKEAIFTTRELQFDSDEESVSENVQYGVQAIEATASIWSRRDLLSAYILIWAIYFVNTLQNTTSDSLTSTVTRNFTTQTLTYVTPIMSNILGNVILLPLAKMLDVWGRPQGLAVMVVLFEIGLIMMAACKNIKTYAAAQVFYWVGYRGINFSLSIFIADTSPLKNRALAFAFLSSPSIITIWIGEPLAAAFLGGPGFEWGYGVFAIVIPIITLPLIALFYRNYRNAENFGLIRGREHGRSIVQSVRFYILEIDLLGLFFIVSGLIMLLVAFELPQYASDGWRSSAVISLIIVGGVCLTAFAVYEKYFEPKTFIPFSLLGDRTFLGACILSGVLFVEFSLWNGYFTSFLRVVDNLDTAQATYITNIYTAGSCFFSLVAGVFIRWMGRFRALALFFGMPLLILGAGLMIRFRHPDEIGYIIMCQIFIAFATGTLVICEQIAIMAATSHQYLAAALAIQCIFARAGTAVGIAIGDAIWNHVFHNKLAEYLPTIGDSEMFEIEKAKISLSVANQLAFPVGSAIRNAINRAYEDAQRDITIAATAVLAVALVAVAVWRDIKVKDSKAKTIREHIVRSLFSFFYQYT